MVKQNLIVLDIDDTLTKSEDKHTDSLLFAMKHFGVENIDTDWRNYKNATDSYIFSVNYEKTHGKAFSFDLIPEFEEIMTERFLTFPDTPEISGAKEIVNYFINHTNYAVCFATGSILQPAYLKLQQANIPMIPEVLESSNQIFTREGIVKSAIEKAKEYYQVSDFNHIISFGDGLWDVLTAQNLGIHFVGINDKNIADFNRMGIKHHISDWEGFNLQKTEEILGIHN